MARLSLAAILAAVLLPTASAQEGWEHSLPDNTVVLVGTRSVDDLRASYAESAMGRFLADPEVEGVFAAVKAELEELGNEADDDLGFDPLELPELLSGAAAFGMLDLSASPLGSEAQFPMIACFVADVGSNREDVEIMIDDQLDEAASNEDVVVTTEEIDGEVVTTVALGSGDDDGDGWVRFGFQDTVLVVAAGEQGLEDAFLDVWDAVGGDAATTLADTEDFREAVGDWDGDGAILYAQVGRILAVLRDLESGPFFQDPAGLAMAETLGFFDLGPLAQTLTMGRDGMRMVRSLRWEPDGALFQLLSAFFTNRPPTLLEFVPVDVQLAMAARLDLVEGFDAVLRMIVATGEADMSDLVAGLAEMDASLGFSLRDDLFASLDGQLAFYAGEVDPAERLPMATESINYALIVGLSDGEAVRTLIDTAVQNSAFRTSLKKEEFQGFDVYKIAVMPGLFLNWAVADDIAVVSPAPTMLHDVLRRKVADDLPTIASDDEFEQSLSEHIEDYAIITYADAASTFNSQIEQLQLVLQQAFAVPYDPSGGSQVPEIVQKILELEPIDQAVIDKYFDKPSVSTFRVDDHGLKGVATSP